MTYIYNDAPKHMLTLNYDYADFIKDPTLYYNDWQDSYYATPELIKHPIDRGGHKLVEMNREEKIVNLNMTELLGDGEYLEYGNIKTKHAPKNIIEPIWLKEFNEWIEGANEDEYLFKRKDRIIEYIQVKRETNELKEMIDEFEMDETLSLMESRLKQLKDEATELGNKAKRIKDNKAECAKMIAQLKAKLLNDNKIIEEKASYTYKK